MIRQPVRPDPQPHDLEREVCNVSYLETNQLRSRVIGIYIYIDAIGSLDDRASFPH